MRPHMPRSPFTTRLSGSARETEQRIRSIVQWKKRRPPVLLLLPALLLIVLCGSLVSCQSRGPAVSLVMDVQYYDTQNNMVEIPRLTAQGELPPGAQQVNDALAQFKEQYASLLSDPQSQPGGTACLFFPAVTDRCYNLVFYQGSSDYGSDGSLFTLVYDRKEDRLVSQEEALDLAGTTLEELSQQAQAFLNDELAKTPEYAAQLTAGQPVLEGFRLREEGNVDFYFSCPAQLKNPDTASLDPWQYLLTCSQGTWSHYTPLAANAAPLISPEELQPFDPPLWYQWSQEGGAPQGGFTPVEEPGLTQDQRNVFADAVNTLLSTYTFPDGVVYEPFDGDLSMDSFAVQDVDGDGQQELLFSCSNTYTAGMSAYILSYQEDGSLGTQLLEFPALTFYDNGLIQVYAHHNQGMAGESFWPYSLYRYDPQIDRYEMTAMVDAWDRSLGETNPLWNNIPYPAETDVSNTGMVYYIMSPGGLDYSHPVDQSDYQAWLDSQLERAQEQTISWYSLTPGNVQALREGNLP